MDIKDLMQQFGQINQAASQFKDYSKKLKVTGESGAGAVRVVLNGSFQVESIELNDSFYEEDRAIAAELIKAAVNDATLKIVVEINTSFMPGGLGLFGAAGGKSD